MAAASRRRQAEKGRAERVRVQKKQSYVSLTKYLDQSLNMYDIEFLQLDSLLYYTL